MQHVEQHVAVARDVVDDQELATRALVADEARRGRRCGRGFKQRHDEIEPEQAAFAGAAVDPDVAAHQAHQLAADREPEAGAAEPALRLADLLERAEDAVDLVGRDADAAVFDFETQRGLRSAASDASHAQSHLAAVGEFHRVAEQVEQHLAQALLVDPHCLRQLGGHRQVEREILFLGLDSNDVGDRRQELDETDCARVQVELAGLDLGQIEHVVDQHQQMLAAVLDRAQAARLSIGQAGIALQDLGVAEHGVQWRSQLMAHAGQKDALRPVRDLGALLCGDELCRALLDQLFEVVAVPAQLLLGVLAFGRVGDEAFAVQDLARVVADHANAR